MPNLHLHQSLVHPGYPQMYYYIREQNLPFSSEEMKKVCHPVELLLK